MKKAYTLTELLVVIVIILVLVSFMFPVFTRAKSKAKETGCLSNIRQLYAALQLYKTDWGDYPMPGNPNILNATYLGGVKLKCSAQHNKWLAADYVLNVGIFNLADISKVKEPDKTRILSHQEAWEGCRALRGPDFPVVWDGNHALPLAGYDTGEEFYLLVRESGQAVRIPASAMDGFITGQVKPPCVRELGVSNL